MVVIVISIYSTPPRTIRPFSGKKKGAMGIELVWTRRPILRKLLRDVSESGQGHTAGGAHLSEDQIRKIPEKEAGDGGDGEARKGRIGDAEDRE